MKTSWKTVSIVALALIGMGMTSAGAQPPQGGPPPDGRPGGPGGERGPGGRFQPRPMTVAMVPVDALKPLLGLTDAQAQKIRAIGDKLRAQMPRPPMPPQGGQNGGQGGGQPPQRPSQQEMEARRAKMEAAQKQATAQINTVLTAQQKQKVPVVLKALSALRRTRLDMRAVAKLKLTDAQIAKLAALGDGATPEKVNAVLSAQQRSVVAANQRRGPGGFGGRGQGQGGRGEGPGGGPGGPPPFE